MVALTFFVHFVFTNNIFADSPLTSFEMLINFYSIDIGKEGATKIHNNFWFLQIFPMSNVVIVVFNFSLLLPVLLLSLMLISFVMSSLL